jgi:hypothetical protein
MCAAWYIMQDIWTGVTYGYWMAIFRTLASTQAVACYLKHW